jgi:Zn-dependent peptidase ImmA (M78 family)/DNA-binding XRE family transcriptional regulator
MSKSVKAPIVPEVLKWARTSACVSVEDAAKAANVTAERLQNWEDGKDSPTLPMLRALAGKYKRPLAVMLLREPPTDFKALSDFRRVTPADTFMAPAVALEIRMAHERRELALEMADELADVPQHFALKASLSENTELVGQRIRDYFGVSTDLQTKWARQAKVFDGWRGALESRGVLVFMMGGAHGPLVKQVRGFAIAHEAFPVIAVNGRDKTNGRTFTLLHECVHLALGQAVVENHLSTYRRLPPADRKVERFCNAVAAAALMPRGLVESIALQLGKGPDSDWSDSEINATADRIGVSREALTLRAVELGFASVRFYAVKRRQFEAEYRAMDEPSGKSVPVPPYKTMVGRYGRTFARMVLNSYHDRRITMNDAAAFLNVQAKHIDYIARQASRG